MNLGGGVHGPGQSSGGPPNLGEPARSWTAVHTHPARTEKQELRLAFKLCILTAQVCSEQQDRRHVIQANAIVAFVDGPTLRKHIQLQELHS